MIAAHAHIDHAELAARVVVCSFGQLAIALDRQMRLIAVAVFASNAEGRGHTTLSTTMQQGVVSFAGDERSHKRGMGLRGGRR
jgi:hypothetical protein